MDDGKEGMSIAKIALGVIIFLILAGVVFALVRLGTNKVNSATNDMSTQLDAADLMQYAKYDNEEVSGADVLTAIKSYQNAELKIFVGVKDGSNFFSPDAASPTALTNTYSYGYQSITGNNNTTSDVPVYDPNTGRWKATIVNYQDPVVYNLSFSPLTKKSSTTTYVKQSGKFYGYLVYDSDTDELAGLMFMQTK